MSRLQRLFVILTTDKTRTDAQSDSRMRLVYEGSSRQEFELGGQPHDERERGRTDMYEFPFNVSVEMEEVRPEQFKIVAAGSDAWLPSSIFILGKSDTAEFRVLVGNDRWPAEGWFSTQTSDANGRAEKARLLDRNGTPTV
jgi:hypothetical protein